MRLRISHSPLPLLALAMVLLTAGCGGLADLLRLSTGLRKDFGQNSVSLNNGTHLTVTFQNSPAAHGADEAATARKAAEYVRDHYPHYAQLVDVSIAWQTHRQYGPVGYTAGAGAYTFTRTDLGPPRR